MQILLLGEDNERLVRVKRRLWYEGVTLDALQVSDWDNQDIYEKILESNVILILYSEDLNQKISKFLDQNRIFILINDRGKLEKENSLKYFKYIFSEPIDYFNLSFLIKTELFNLKKLNLPKEVVFKKIVLNLENRYLSSGQKSCFLRNKEFALMRFFLENPGRLLTRMSILENVWDINADLFTNTVDVHVSRLRKLLKDLDGEYAYIKTIPCSGYVFE